MFRHPAPWTNIPNLLTSRIWHPVSVLTLTMPSTSRTGLRYIKQRNIIFILHLLHP